MQAEKTVCLHLQRKKERILCVKEENKHGGDN